MDDDKPKKATIRTTITLTNDVKAMLDELVERGNMDRNAVLATLVQWTYDNPQSPFIARQFRDGSGEDA